MNENENNNKSNVLDAAKAELKGKFMALNLWHLENKLKKKINLNSHFRKPNK